MASLREYPIKREERQIHHWQEGKAYDISANNELILCNVRLQQKMLVRYVLVDPDFFILVEPDFSNQDQYQVKVAKKVPLKQVQGVIDRSESRHLLMGFATFQEGMAKPVVEELTIYFETTHKCSYVKSLLDSSKKSAKAKLQQKVTGFLNDCLEEFSP